MVHQVRIKNGLKQSDLAARLGVTPRYLSELETGKPKVLSVKLLDVLDQLGIELILREV